MTDNSPAELTAGIILAGGQASRFDYQDKGLIEWRGQPLLAHVIDRIKSQTQTIIINCNRNIEHYQTFNYRLCSDQQAGYLGPIAGIVSALTLVEKPYVLICACDTPQIPLDLVEQLLLALTVSGADVAYPVCVEHNHYLPVLLKTKLLPVIDNYLETGGRSLKGLFASLHSVAVNFDNEQAFSNFNQPSDMC